MTEYYDCAKTYSIKIPWDKSKDHWQNQAEHRAIITGFSIPHSNIRWVGGSHAKDGVHHYWHVTMTAGQRASILDQHKDIEISELDVTLISLAIRNKVTLTYKASYPTNYMDICEDGLCTGDFEDLDIQIVEFFYNVAKKQAQIFRTSSFLSILDKCWVWRLAIGYAKEYGYEWEPGGKQLAYAEGQFMKAINRTGGTHETT